MERLEKLIGRNERDQDFIRKKKEKKRRRQKAKKRMNNSSRKRRKTGINDQFSFPCSMHYFDIQ